MKREPVRARNRDGRAPLAAGRLHRNAHGGRLGAGCACSLGFFAGKILKLSKETVARLLIYILAPAVNFYGIFTLDFHASLLFLPLTYFCLSLVTCGIGYALASRFWRDAHRNILGFTSGTGNTGYFGFPVAIAIFGEKALGLMVLGSLGAVIYENTVGFFLVARGHHDARESVMRVLTLPTIYAAAIGLVCNLAGLHLPVPVNDMFVSARGAYTILGAMMVGLGLVGASSFRIDGRFTGIAFLLKFLVWPALMLALMHIDAMTAHLFSSDVRNILLLLSIVPLAANTVAFATELNTEPEKAATAVFLSTFFALFFIPFMVVMFF